LGEAGANAVGAHWIGASPTGVRPSYTGLNAQTMFQSRLRAYILMGFDPDLDVYNPALAMQALKSANAVIALSSYKTPSLLDVAQVLLPIAPFSETSGSFVNIEGVLQSFNAVAQPYKSTLPAWRVLMALLQGLSDDESNIHTSFESLHAAMSEVLQDVKATLNNGIQADKLSYTQSKEIAGGWYRLGDVLPYSVDPILRRATALQKRELKQRARVSLHPLDIQQLGVEVGASVKLRQSGAVSVVTVYSDASLSRRSVRVPHTTVLGGLMDPIEIEKG
jgi:NADH-quinone oxidoreductase subunit G